MALRPKYFSMKNILFAFLLLAATASGQYLRYQTTTAPVPSVPAAAAHLAFSNGGVVGMTGTTLAPLTLAGGLTNAGGVLSQSATASVLAPGTKATTITSSTGQAAITIESTGLGGADVGFSGDITLTGTAGNALIDGPGNFILIGNGGFNDFGSGGFTNFATGAFTGPTFTITNGGAAQATLTATSSTVYLTSTGATAIVIGGTGAVLFPGYNAFGNSSFTDQGTGGFASTTGNFFSVSGNFITQNGTFIGNGAGLTNLPISSGTGGSFTFISGGAPQATLSATSGVLYLTSTTGNSELVLGGTGAIIFNGYNAFGTAGFTAQGTGGFASTTGNFFTASGTFVGNGGGLTGTNYNIVTAGQGVNPAVYGALGNGSHDDTTALQNALAVCGSTGQPLVLTPGATYLTSAPLVWQYAQNSFIGNGANIDSTGTLGIIVSSTATSFNIPDANRYEMNGVRIYGVWTTGTAPPFSQVHVGILMGNGAGTSAANCIIRNCSINNVDIGVDWAGQPNSYLQKFDNDQIFNTNWCLYADPLTGGTNSGENIRFSKCVFFNSANIAYDNIAYEFNFSQCSLDYAQWYTLFCNNGAHADLSQCHIETAYDNDAFFRCESPTGLGPSEISMDQSTIVITDTGARSNYIMETSSNTYGCIRATKMLIDFANGYAKQTIGNGNVYVSAQMSCLGFSAAIGGSFADNLLADGGFDNTPATLPEWTVSGTAGISLDNTTYVSGTTSLKFLPASGTSSSITFTQAIAPGTVPTVTYWIKNAFANNSDTFRVQASITSAANPSYSTGTVYGITYDNLGTNYAAWTQQGFSTKGWCPGGGILTVTFSTNTATGGTSANWIDNVLIEAR